MSEIEVRMTLDEISGLLHALAALSLGVNLDLEYELGWT
jgi:hypothetical protein